MCTMSSKVLVARYRAGSTHQDQVVDLVEAVVKSVSLETLELAARKAISRALSQDGDGLLIGAVYHDGFDKGAFVQALVRKLRSSKVVEDLAQCLLEELEDRK